MVKWLGCGFSYALLHGKDLFPVVPDLTLPCFAYRQLVASRQLGLLIMFLISLNGFFKNINKAFNYRLTLVN